MVESSFIKLAENKKYYTSVNTLEPGVEMNIIQSSSTNETIVELYEVTSFDQLNRILVFWKLPCLLQSIYRNQTRLEQFRTISTKKKLSQFSLEQPEIPTLSENLLDDASELIQPTLLQEVSDEEETQDEFVDPFLAELEDESEDTSPSIKGVQVQFNPRDM